MAQGLDDFLHDIRNMPLGDFSPSPFYEPETDSLIVYARNERSYRKRLNSLLTLYLSVSDDSLVGCEIKGVRRIMKGLSLLKGSRLNVLVEDHCIRLSVFLAFAIAMPEPAEDDELLERYRDELAGYGDVQVDSGELAGATC